ncbi:fructose-1,6-bisphosphatase 1 isoform X2 [Lepeophtheirus salmonis]|uniref:fructose-bisphosphatase n=3 Tax=Lepeophtheirus salmonis TaxID=72036 RepID=C1BSW7_LEPSM|nr:fructose-1,6-bisphosphatase 1-like isoform X2 [Lepeophtheirus salmonis]XP_040574786.1 fructose-1,6-bisphosphatase 1-like isoform X2 [Lepeophtheirus salmonis]XP_040574787.1 fructose-1,6-bisphosphatase 1-like isoform X2 [Lepeophtheirus salmonis]ACO12120.1 Fructose-1,6-bisphosphatase 1 [Lepeophtheirus salmonis]ADD38856.1 Fructose-1,6-bisphosphatase 1 [Lepeophtheirus salmonis]
MNLSTNDGSTDTLSQSLMCDLMNKEGGAELVGLVVTLQSICKNISAAVRRAGISRLFGAHGSINIQGEDQQKLDILANQIFIKQLTKSCTTCLLVSEEMDNVVEVEPEKAGNYIVCFDPLDGSNNIDCLASIGSIFAVYKRKTPKGSPPTLEDVLQPGKNLIAAGYALYGSATVMMLSTGSGVDKYILDPSTGEFLLSERNIKISSDRVQYSVNESYSGSWDPKILDFVENKKKGPNPTPQRYIGTFIADFHRTLMYGGIFLYPANKFSPKGKLRLLYECNPASFLMQQAGGIGSTGKEHVLDIKPRTIHDRCPVYLGAIKEIDQLHSFLNVDKLRERIN